MFHYSGRDAAGSSIRGSIAASSRDVALAHLRNRSICVTALEIASTPRGRLAAIRCVTPVSAVERVAFFRALSTLAGAGVPVRRALDVSVEQCRDARLGESLRSVRSDIEGGLPLSEALSRHPAEFSPPIVAAIHAGELSGTLDQVLTRLASALERERALRNRVGAALTYPAIVAAAAVGLILFLLTSIIPMFRSMYAQLHAPLPPLTALLMAVGETLHSRVIIALAAAMCAAAVVGVSYVRTVPAIARWYDTVRLSAPLIGTIVRRAALARVGRLLGTLLQSGVGIIVALRATAAAISSPCFAQSLEAAAAAVARGASLSDSLTDRALYEPVFALFVRTGEETGSVDAMLMRAADYYDLDVESALTAFTAALEPIFTILLGGCVAFILAAVFVPLYALIGTLK